MLGIKHQGRWIVLWHPGELKDAWKTGHNGIAPDLAGKAYETGFNIICYACRKHGEFVQEQNKTGITR